MCSTQEWEICQVIPHAVVTPCSVTPLARPHNTSVSSHWYNTFSNPAIRSFLLNTSELCLNLDVCYLQSHDCKCIKTNSYERSERLRWSRRWEAVAFPTPSLIWNHSCLSFSFWSYPYFTSTHFTFQQDYSSSFLSSPYSPHFLRIFYSPMFTSHF